MMNNLEYLDSLASSIAFGNKALQVFNNNDEKSCQSDKDKLRSHLFFRIIITAGSIFKLLKETEFFSHSINEQSTLGSILDFPSIASLTRNIMDAYRLYYYLGVQRITEQEFEFRKLLWEWHYCCEKNKMINFMTNNKKNPNEFDNDIVQIKESIQNNTFYTQVFSKEEYKGYEGLNRKQLSNPNLEEQLILAQDCFLSREFVVSEKILELDNSSDKEKIKSRIKYMYKLLSNYTHSNPYAIANSLFWEHDLNSELKKVISCVGFYLWIATDDLLKIRPDIQSHIAIEQYQNRDCLFGIFLSFLSRDTKD